MSDKKGMSMQVFTFIFALIFMALVLGYGAKTLVNVKDVSEDVELADFILKLKEEVDTMYAFDVGSSKNMKFFLPSKVARICFYDSSKDVNVVNIDKDLNNYLITNPGKNMFVMPFVFAQNTHHVEHLTVSGENPLCFLPKGKLDVRFETVLGEDGKVYVEVQRQV